MTEEQIQGLLQAMSTRVRSKGFASVVGFEGERTFEVHDYGEAVWDPVRLGFRYRGFFASLYGNAWRIERYVGDEDEDHVSISIQSTASNPEAAVRTAVAYIDKFSGTVTL